MATDALRFLGSNLAGELPNGFSYTGPMVLDKRQSIFQYVSYMLDRTNRMFEYDGLPDTIPDYMLEQYLQWHGVVAIGRAETLFPQDRLDGKSDGLYCFFGGWGDKPDIYYRPTSFVVANPALKESHIWKIGAECEIIRNDTRCIGLLPLFFRYAEQMAENDISIRSAQINTRQRTVISAGTDEEKASAEEYLSQIEAGQTGVIAENPFLQGVKVQNAGTISANTIIQLIELQQYLKASWFNELGLNANFNMKREYLSAEELAASTDVLLPLVDDMLYCRQSALERINSMFGTNITVRKSSAWENKERESEAKIKTMEVEADNADKGTSADGASE